MIADLANACKSSLDAALGFFYPECCQVCGQQRADANTGYVCADCGRQIRRIEPPWCRRCGRPFAGNLTSDFVCAPCQETVWHFREARSLVAAQGVLLDIVHRYKYNRAMWFETFLAGLLRERAGGYRRDDWDLIVPVPLHFVKQQEREFNQAERLARVLAEATGIPVDTGLIKRTVYTETQTRLHRAERAVNVRRAFQPRRGARLRGERVLLFDDVFTTGATTNECARVLSQLGAGEIGVLTLARGL